jgi:hypothetical protein
MERKHNLEGSDIFCSTTYTCPSCQAVYLTPLLSKAAEQWTLWTYYSPPSNSQLISKTPDASPSPPMYIMLQRLLVLGFELNTCFVRQVLYPLSYVPSPFLL